MADPASLEQLDANGSLTGAAPPATVSGSGSPARARGRAIWIAIIAIAVVLAILVAGFVTGVVPGLRSSPSPDREIQQLTYNQAAPLANAVASVAPDGPWTPFIAEGVNSLGALGWEIPIDCISLVTGTAEYLSNARPSAPSDEGSFAAGAFSWWTFLYDNGTTNAEGDGFVLDVGVVNATAIAIATFASNCYPDPTVFHTLPATAEVDSSAAQATVMANSSFFTAYPQLNVTAIFFYDFPGTVSSPGWTWTFDFTSCPLFNTASPNTTFYPGAYDFSLVNATSGALDLWPSSQQPQECSALPSDT